MQEGDLTECQASRQQYRYRWQHEEKGILGNDKAYLPSVTVGEKSGRNTVISVKNDDKSIKIIFIKH